MNKTVTPKLITKKKDIFRGKGNDSVDKPLSTQTRIRVLIPGTHNKKQAGMVVTYNPSTQKAGKRNPPEKVG